jgi:hypothetical protein
VGDYLELLDNMDPKVIYFLTGYLEKEAILLPALAIPAAKVVGSLAGWTALQDTFNSRGLIRSPADQENEILYSNYTGTTPYKLDAFTRLHPKVGIGSIRGWASSLGLGSSSLDKDKTDKIMSNPDVASELRYDSHTEGGDLVPRDKPFYYGLNQAPSKEFIKQLRDRRLNRVNPGKLLNETVKNQLDEMGERNFTAGVEAGAKKPSLAGAAKGTDKQGWWDKFTAMLKDKPEYAIYGAAGLIGLLGLWALMGRRD